MECFALFTFIFKLKHNFNFFRLCIISMEVPRDMLASYCSKSMLESESLQEKLLGCVGLLMYDCTNVLAQQNTILQEVKTELTELRNDLKERKATSTSGSTLKGKIAKQNVPLSEEDKLKFSVYSNKESQSKKRKLSTQNPEESVGVIYKDVKPEPKPEIPPESHLNSFTIFKKLDALSTGKSSYNPPQDRKSCVPEDVKTSVQSGAYIGKTIAKDYSMTKSDVGQTYVCTICSKRYKQFIGGIVKHLIEFHNVQQRPEALAKHFTQVHEIKDG